MKKIAIIFGCAMGLALVFTLLGTVLAPPPGGLSHRVVPPNVCALSTHSSLIKASPAHTVPGMLCFCLGALRP